MQPLNSEQPLPPARWWVIGLIILVTIGLYFGSRIEGPGIPTAMVARPRVHDGITIKLACSDKEFRAGLQSLVASWSAETGATVDWLASNAEEADLAIISPPELGSQVVGKRLLPLPTTFQQPEHPAQWSRIAVNYRLELCQWGGTIYAVPLAADTSVLVYRADKLENPQHMQDFAKKFSGRRLGASALASWEDVLDVADYFFHAEQQPSLPPLPRDPQRLMLHYQQIAACYDRLAATDALKLQANRGFYFTPSTGEPRLRNGAFAAAADWFAVAAKYRQPDSEMASPDDQLDALLSGKAVLAVLTASEIGRLPRGPNGEVSPIYQVTRMPGTRSWFPNPGERRPTSQVNYVPFIGYQSKIGVVFDRKNPARESAAWDLLIELSSPAANTELLCNPRVGIGPIREEQLGNNDRDTTWYNYGFDADRTALLADAFRNYAPRAVSRPIFALRTPDQQSLLVELERAVRQVAQGQLLPAQAMSQAQSTWEKLIAAQSPAEVQRWRQSDSGLR